VVNEVQLKKRRGRMNKLIVGFLMTTVLLLTTAVTVLADEPAHMGRKVFSMNGEFIEFVPFSFTVPSGNCGNVKTSEFIPSYNFPIHTVAYWQELAPWAQVASYSAGLFKFTVSDVACSPEFLLEGELSDMDYYGNWTGMEVEPEDLGVLTGLGKASNYFRLPTDDRQFSYVIVFPRYGYKHTLDQLVDFAGNGNSGIQPSGSTLVGAIVPNAKGYLSQKIFYPNNLNYSAKMLKVRAKDRIIYDDQIVVLIYQEHYQ
jgi:hypothetical protein